MNDPHLVRDLSPGDKLSLKGKIFELQRKLNLIDLETRINDEITSELPFKPTIYTSNYSPLSSNGKNDSGSSNIFKAEIIQKQKKELLKETLRIQEDEVCTFSPTIFTKSSRKNSVIRNDNKPAFERLYESGKVYEKKKIERDYYLTNYDDEGNKLFIPRINKTSPIPSSDVIEEIINNNSSPLFINTIPADEYLYQDAKDREQRVKQRDKSFQQELDNVANRQKINSTSTILLKRKAEREVRTVFSFIDANDIGSIGQENLLNAYNYLIKTGILSEEMKYENVQTIWNILDIEKSGNVTLAVFLSVCSPLLFHNTINMAILDIKKITVNSPLKNSDKDNNASSQIYSLKTDDYQCVKSFLIKIKSLIDLLRESTSTTNSSNTRKALSISGISKVSQSHDDSNNNSVINENEISILTDASKVKRKIESSKNPDQSFNIKISDYSKRLVLKKEEKERKQIAAALLMSQTSDIKDNQTKILIQLENKETENLKEALEKVNSKAHNLTEKFNQVLNKCEIDELITNTPSKEDPTTLFGSPSQEVKESSFKNHHAIMLARGIMSEQKKIEKAVEFKEKELSECTFKPKIFSASFKKRINKKDQDENNITEDTINNNNNGSPQMKLQEENVFDRLYSSSAEKNIPPPPPPPSAADEVSSIASSEPPSAEKPPTFLNSKPLVVSGRPIEGFDKTIQRMRLAHEETTKKKIEKENEYKVQSEKYIKNRELLVQHGAVPFDLKCDKRIKESKELKKKKTRKPGLIIDVKLSKTKSAKIKVRHGDNPVELAEKFSKIYSLDSASTTILTEVVRQSMNDNDLSISDLKRDRLEKSDLITKYNTQRSCSVTDQNNNNDDAVSAYTISDNESIFDQESDDSYTEESYDV